MKKVFCAMLVANLCSLAQASQIPMHPYIGLDYAVVNMHYTSDDFSENLPNDHDGVAPYFGVLFNKYFGVEAGYFQTRAKEKTLNIVNADLKTEYNGFTADAIARCPILWNSGFMLVGSVGGVHTRAKVEGTALGATATDSLSDTTIRLGAGIQYQFIDQIGIRAKAYYAPVHFNKNNALGEITDYMLTFTAGINYSF